MASGAGVQPDNTNWLQIIASPEDASVDIVAVHGMNLENKLGHAENAWTDRTTGLNWLRDLLPLRLTESRILAFRYNANILKGASIAGVQEQAKNLLNCMLSKRKEYDVRPILFIAHSLGGIIVKEALATAHENNIFSSIRIYTYGIMFLGVPHRGTELVNYCTILANIARCYYWAPKNSFLESVQAQSEYNDELNTRFNAVIGWYMFYTFCETLPEENVGCVIVQPDSAELGLEDIYERKFYPNKTHRDICKFATAEDPSWIEFSDTIADAVSFAISTYIYSPNAKKRKQMIEQASMNSANGFHHHGSQRPPRPPSLTEAIHRGQNALQCLERESKDESMSQLGFFYGAAALAAFLYPFVIFVSPLLAVGSFSYLALWFLPSKDTIMSRADSARVEQLEHVTSQEIEIQRHDEHRDVALQAVQDLRLALQNGRVAGQEGRNLLVGQDVVASSLLTQLLKSVHIHGIKFQELNERYEESEKRLRLIEQGQTAIASMNDQEAWIYIAQNAEMIKAEQDEKRLEDDEGSGSCCVIL